MAALRTGRRRATERRALLPKAGAATVAASTTLAAPSVIAQPRIQWRLSTAWPPQLDMLQGAAQRLARIVDEMSGGRFRIDVFSGGQIMKPFECFDATSNGTIEAFMAASYYWTAKDPAVEWFTTVPFGLDPQGMAVWYYHGDGQKLWEETYAPFNLVPRLGPGFAPQMGGWFRKKIDTIADYKGMKMRMGTGLGGKVIARAGGTAVLTPAAEIYTSLERGVIDAAEWVGPHDDLELGLQNTARYYYYPGWHEPGTVGEFVFNRKAYDALPVDLRRILDFATTAVQVHGFMDYHAKNLAAVSRLRTQFASKVELIEFPAPVLRDLRKLAIDVVHEQSTQSQMARKVHASFEKFSQQIGPWDRVAQGAYHQFLKS
jgi:TRAP-type mannitol/chloroaromatic compound transport system substrate-binding protein